MLTHFNTFQQKLRRADGRGSTMADREIRDGHLHGYKVLSSTRMGARMGAWWLTLGQLRSPLGHISITWEEEDKLHTLNKMRRQPAEVRGRERESWTSKLHSVTCRSETSWAATRTSCHCWHHEGKTPSSHYLKPQPNSATLVPSTHPRQSKEGNAAQVVVTAQNWKNTTSAEWGDAQHHWARLWAVKMITSATSTESMRVGSAVAKIKLTPEVTHVACFLSFTTLIPTLAFKENLTHNEAPNAH